LILMSADKAKELGVKPLARVVSYADAGVDPIEHEQRTLPVTPYKSSLWQV